MRRTAYDIPTTNRFWAIIAFCLLSTFVCGCSLIVEPFLPYYWDENQTSISDFGFVGFRKYIKRGNQRFVEQTTERINAQALFGYKVFIDGAECNDDLTANGYAGKALFNTTRPTGSKLVIKLLSAPVIREDSNDRIADLVGVEMEAILP